MSRLILNVRQRSLTPVLQTKTKSKDISSNFKLFTFVIP